MIIPKVEVESTSMEEASSAQLVISALVNSPTEERHEKQI